MISGYNLYMKKPVVYLVCGVAASGKSWVCEQLTHYAKYIQHDQTSTEEVLQQLKSATVPVVYDLFKPISTFITKNQDFLDIRLILVLGDYLEIKERLKKRSEGRNETWQYSVGLMKRWERIKSLTKHPNAIFSGSSKEVLDYIREELSLTRDNIIYKVTSPSGKVYIGKTSMKLENRIICHKYDAYTRNSKRAICNAIRKYGDNMIWEILQSNISSYGETNFLERKYIKEYKSTNSKFGYNLTEGGDGGQLVGDSYIKKTRAMKKFYASAEGNIVKEKLRVSSLKMRQSAVSDVINSKVRATRQTPESRLKTSILSKARYADQVARDSLSKTNKEVYKDPVVRRKIALAVREARAKPFQVWAPDGLLLGTWDNASTCAEDLKLSRGNISNCLNGYATHHKGYKFKRIPVPESNNK